MTDKLPWLALRAVPGVGLVLYQRLLQKFASPAAVFHASPAELRSIKGITPALAKALVSFRAWDQVEARISQVEAHGAEMVTQADPRFPKGLKEIPYPPPFLFVQGTLQPEDELAVALVGTRAASYYGF